MISAEVGCKIAKEIAEKTGINGVVPDLFHRKKALNSFRVENEIALKKLVIESQELSYDQKVVLNSYLGKSLKKFQHQLEVLDISIDNMGEDADINNIDEDWLLDFFDKVSNISNKDTQKVWAKLLAYSASDKKICSKTLLNSLFLMSSEDISCFLNICRFTFSEMNTDVEGLITAYPIIYFSEYVNKYNVYGFSTFNLNKLQRLGLIEVDFMSEYVFSKKKMKLRYKNKLIELEAKEKIKIGNIRFTYDGFLLYQMTEKGYNSGILNELIDVWRYRKYNVYLNGRKISDKSNTKY